MNLAGRRLYNSAMKGPYVPKANASSYTRKSTNSPTSSATSRYRKSTTTSSPADSTNSGSDPAPTSSSPSFDPSEFSSPPEEGTGTVSSGFSSYSSPTSTHSFGTGFNAVKSAETASRNTDAFQKVKTINSFFPITLKDGPQQLQQQSVISNETNWSTSFFGIGSKPFPKESQDALAAPLDPKEIEIKPEGLIYLPEIKYRRILNKAFGAGGWGLVPRSETIVTDSLVTREYGLVCLGQLVSVARGEQDYFGATNIPMATEGCKSNALMRCCKDLGIASELWDPGFIKQFKQEYCEDKFVEHVVNGKKKKIWKRKDRSVEYPFKLTTFKNF